MKKQIKLNNENEEKEIAVDTSKEIKNEEIVVPQKKQLNIYKKIRQVQSKIGKLIKDEHNKFQNYKYFSEQQVLGLLKPLLDEAELVVLLSDDERFDLTCEKQEQGWFVKYRKWLLIADTESGEEVNFYFWATGSNQDPSKAKGSTETYATKYILSKFFLIPVGDENDPDRDTRIINSSSSIGTKKSIFGKCQFSENGKNCENEAKGVKTENFKTKSYCNTHLSYLKNKSYESVRK